MRPIKIFIFLFSLLFLEREVFADTIYLVDGRSYKGEFVRGNKHTLVFQSGSVTMGFPRSSVLSIFFGEGDWIGKEPPGFKKAEEKKGIDDKVKSEILRGDTAIFDVTLKGGVDLPRAAGQISAVLEENRKRNTATAPFILGAYFKAWNSFASMIKVLREREKPDYQEIIAMGEKSAKIYFTEFRKKQKELGLDDKTLLSITEVKFEVVKPQIDEWESKIKKEEEDAKKTGPPL